MRYEREEYPGTIAKITWTRNDLASPKVSGILDDMNVLVTGGCGFLGSAFIRRWHQEHPQDIITNLDSLTYAANPRALEVAADSSQYRFVEGNITDTRMVSEAMKGAELVVHFAAETHVDRSITGPAVFVETNVLGTQVLLDAARMAKVTRFHHVSTDEVFGALPLEGDERFSETTPYNPHSPYSASKAAADHLVRAYGTTYGLPITVSSCSNNYGPWQYPEKLIPLMIRQALADEKLPIYGDGKNVRDWIHVDDHIRGVIAVIERGKLGETYCLGADAERDNLTLVKLLLKLVNKPESLIEFVEDRAGHDRRYAVDSSKAQRELGWKPERSFEEGMRETVLWYQEHQEELQR
jgi:dTDP-glucose 4,6-dehydratase